MVSLLSAAAPIGGGSNGRTLTGFRRFAAENASLVEDLSAKQDLSLGPRCQYSDGLCSHCMVRVQARLSRLLWHVSYWLIVTMTL